MAVSEEILAAAVVNAIARPIIEQTLPILVEQILKTLGGADAVIKIVRESDVLEEEVRKSLGVTTDPSQ